MRDLIFARHIFSNVNVRCAFDMCVDDIYIQMRVQNEDAFDDFLFFFVFVWTTINLNTFPRELDITNKYKYYSFPDV